jgi:hypothetical protein
MLSIREKMRTRKAAYTSLPSNAEEANGLFK